MDLLRQMMANAQGGGHKQPRAEPVAPQAVRRIETWSAASIETAKLPPREFLLGDAYCKRFLSSYLATGGTGKTSLVISQALAMASGRPLTGEHVYGRYNVVLVCFEDDADELDRRVGAAMQHHKVKPEDIQERFQLAVLKREDGKLMVIDPETRQPTLGPLAASLEMLITEQKIDVLILDPLKKIHGVEENSNDHMDAVAQVLTDMASKFNIAINTPHHTNKGAGDPGNADRGRGASAFKDAARLGYTMTGMSVQDAAQFRVPEDERKWYSRVDSAKVNIVPPARGALWFRLVNVRLDNGDQVQAIEPWSPPDLMAGMGKDTATRILMEIRDGPGDGERYSNATGAKERCVSRAFELHEPGKTASDARQIVKQWIKDGVVRVGDYYSPAKRKQQQGLFVSIALTSSDEGEA
ncbi:AAA domain-containing protein [Mesorhizobium tianshanense]|uniref:AAA domain-containing protein n=2 Tax=Mesorhizobium tianshanense TaxID=39844 RepID=A0A562NSW3_9HYPH|nr:AAA domain-containing protein [Mesorhizobium tianshanense]